MKTVSNFPGMDQTDTAHLGVFRGESARDPLANSVIFSRQALRYGVNRRNLLYLQTLRRMDILAAAIDRIGPDGKDATPAKASCKVVRKKLKRG